MSDPAGLAALLGRWPSLAAFARDIGVTVRAADMMVRRGRIARTYWPAVEIAARRRRIAGVTRELLERIGQRRNAA